MAQAERQHDLELTTRPLVDSGNRIGSAALTLMMLTISAAGSVQVQGTGATTLPLLTTTASGSTQVQGTGTISLPMLTVSATTASQIQGTSATTVPILTTGAGGAVTVAGDASITLPGLSTQIEPAHWERGIMFDTGAWSGAEDKAFEHPTYGTVAWWQQRLIDFGSRGYKTLWLGPFATSSNASSPPGAIDGGSWYPYQTEQMDAAWNTWWQGGQAATDIAAAGFTKIYIFLGKNVIANVSLRDSEADTTPADGVPDWYTGATTPDWQVQGDLDLQQEVIDFYTDYHTIEGAFLDNRTADNVPGVPGGGPAFEELDAALPNIKLGTEAFIVEKPGSEYILQAAHTDTWQFQTRLLTETIHNSDPYNWDLSQYTGRFWMINAAVGGAQRDEKVWFHKRLGQTFEPIAWWPVWYSGTSITHADDLFIPSVGGVLVQGTASITLPLLTTDATATAPGQGVATPTLPLLTLSASAVVPRNGTASITLPLLTTAADGALLVQGTASTTLPLLTVVGSSESAASGQAALTLPLLTLTADTSVLVEGTAAITLPLPTLTAEAGVDVGGTAAVTLPMLTVEAIGGNLTLGSASVTLPMLTVSAAGVVPRNGSATTTLPMLSITASGAVPRNGAGAVTLPMLVLSASGSGPLAGATGDAAITLPMLFTSTDCPPIPSVDIVTSGANGAQAPVGVVFSAYNTVLGCDHTGSEINIHQHYFKWTFLDSGGQEVTNEVISNDFRDHASSDSFDLGVDQRTRMSGFVFTTPDTYTVRLTVYARYVNATSDLTELVGVTDQEITIAARTGTKYYFGNDGNDGNDGLTTTTAKLSPEEAASLCSTANTTIVWKKGETHLMTGTTSLAWGGAGSVWTSEDAYGTGAKPIIKWTGTTPSVGNMFTGTAVRSMLKDIDLETGVDSNNGQHQAWEDPSDTCLYNLEFKGTRYGPQFGRPLNLGGSRFLGVNVTWGPHYGFTAGGGGDDIVFIGCDFGNAEGEPGLRWVDVNGSVCVEQGTWSSRHSYQSCAHRRLYGDNKDGIRWQASRGGDVYRGMLECLVGHAFDEGHCHSIIYDSCQWYSERDATIGPAGATRHIWIRHNCKDLMWRSCIFDSEGATTTSQRGNSDDPDSAGATPGCSTESDWTERNNIRWLNITYRMNHPVNQRRVLVCNGSHNVSTPTGQRWRNQKVFNILTSDILNQDNGSTLIATNNNTGGGADPDPQYGTCCFPDDGETGTHGNGYLNDLSRTATLAEMPGSIWETISTTQLSPENDYDPASTAVLTGGTARPDVFTDYLGVWLPVDGNWPIGAIQLAEPGANITLPMLTVSGTGTVSVGNTATLTLPLLTCAATAVAPVQGTASLTLPLLTTATDGDVHVAADANVTLPMLTIVAAGADVPIATGEAAITLPMLTLSASVGVAVAGQSAITLPMLTIDATQIVGRNVSCTVQLCLTLNIRTSLSLLQSCDARLRLPQSLEQELKL
jgi:hypothetical protein